MSTKPAIGLYDHQLAWIADKARFKAGRWSRQSGKSHVLSLEAVDDLAEKETRGLRDDWLMASAGERQALELIRKAKMHTEAYRIAASGIGEDYFENTQLKTFMITFPAGSRIIAVPANPDTVRGYTANVILDEFALHKNSRDIWAALLPSVTKGRRKLRVASTPNGRENKFYEICTDPAWSEHVVSIYDAVAGGLDADPEELKEALGDEDLWRQEYLVEFVDEATAFLTYEMISSCEEEAAGQPEISSGGDLYVGVDIGRRRDLTVIWIIEAVGDVAWTREVKVLEKAPFRVQREELFGVLSDRRVRRCEIDETGIGMQLAEETMDAFGAWTVEPVTFTARVKEALATRLRSAFEDRLVRIPQERKIRDDLHSVKKVTTAAGNIRFDAERTKDGHADRFWALALAWGAWRGGETRISGKPLILHGRGLACSAA